MLSNELTKIRKELKDLYDHLALIKWQLSSDDFYRGTDIKYLLDVAMDDLLDTNDKISTATNQACTHEED